MNDREVLLGVTGGIAAYKTAELCSRLVQAGAGVSVVMTTSAEKFIGPTTFEALTGRPVHRQLFQPQEHHIGEHIGLVRRADLLVVAPASANCLAKFAHGLADDLLSTIALTHTGPILMAPAMNSEMWQKPSVQRNIAQLREDGVLFIEPGSGWLSCGQVGPGRMAEAAEILDRVRELLDVSS
ncbi:Phosphopantothenoylcysteine decarboxylase [Symmachiella macrocystis]|uniref:Phosphopantothenoylcysteine decarboxylase n=1 Tax=Symmachiella macrocystis TaxID=2527985 RepID=A0A5C6BRS4_9PLAN|nr:bifunctional phosphopantothenoylcysteine decarboxylase/phosphopantothenate--cysteine ligase CoaBC [Symmachiella macrocystis]TWU14412.1 Phosphopantothenoylcysteine decarboxylase [Symmachiella macrocystis]